MRFYWERVEASRNFANKVWNASRFIMMNDPDNKIKTTDEQPDNLTAADKWILSKMNHLIAEVTENMENMSLVLLLQNLTISYGRNSAIGILRWLSLVFTMMKIQQKCSNMDIKDCTY